MSAFLVWVLSTCLLVGIYLVAKVFTRGRWIPSYAATEGILVGIIALACFAAWYSS